MVRPAPPPANPQTGGFHWPEYLNGRTGNSRLRIAPVSFSGAITVLAHVLARTAHSEAACRRLASPAHWPRGSANQGRFIASTAIFIPGDSAAERGLPTARGLFLTNTMPCDRSFAKYTSRWGLATDGRNATKRPCPTAGMTPVTEIADNGAGVVEPDSLSSPSMLVRGHTL